MCRDYNQCQLNNYYNVVKYYVSLVGAIGRFRVSISVGRRGRQFDYSVVVVDLAVRGALQSVSTGMHSTCTMTADRVTVQISFATPDLLLIP